MIYSNEEIELTLNLYSIAKSHINELNQKKQIERLEDFNKYEKNDYLYYLHIVSIVNNWMKELLPDELEIITLRNFEKMSFDLISIHVGYANHSSIIRKYRKIYSIILTILTLFLGEHWILFMVLLLLNIIDTLTGWIKSRINNKENSMAGLKGIMKKLVQWILVLLAFVIPVCFKELGAVINIDLSILAFLGWYVLASLIINEYRSILENLVEAGCDVPQVLVKGLEVASKKIENFNENE